MQTTQANIRRDETGGQEKRGRLGLPLRSGRTNRIALGYELIFAGPTRIRLGSLH